MAINYGTTSLNKVNYGSTSLKKVYYGSTLVFEEALPYLLFTSTEAFGLKSRNNVAAWNGTMQYSTDGSTWTTWSGTTGISATQSGTSFQLMLRGISNTYIKGELVSGTITTTNPGLRVTFSTTNAPVVHVKGNIENLLDYATVSAGNHPTMADYCYQYLFGGQVSLFATALNNLDVSELELPATTLTTGCYDYMFAGCSNGLDVVDYGFTKAPIMAKDITAMSYSYRGMFQNCSHLTDISTISLDGGTPSNYSYAYMFQNTGITTAPKLTVGIGSGNYACHYMFSGCTSLSNVSQITLSGSYLGDYCYSYMFSGCTMLVAAPSMSTSNNMSGTYCYYRMFNGCTSLTTVPTLSATTLTTGCYAGMFQGCTSLVSGDAINAIFSPARTLATYCYQNMFMNCTGLTTIPALPATTLQDYCYAGLFYGCTNINTTSYTLSATTVKPYCYYQMFRGCTGLTKLPTISASTLADYCFSEMFYGCSGLGSNVMSSFTLLATTLQTGCYKGMFQNCTNIVAMPSLSSISTFPNYACSYMFSGCSKLTSINMSSSINVNSYACEYMFQNCTSLATFPTITLKPTASSSYNFRYMFSGCTNLATIIVSFSTANTTSLGAYACAYMFQNCSKKTGSIVSTSLPFTTIGNYAYSYMFSGCSKITSAPSISATSLGTYAMEYMFSGCSALTTPPTSLLATTLSSRCYQYMFQNCTSLTYTPIIKATTVATYCCQYMFSGCTALLYLPKLKALAMQTGCYYYMFSGCSSIYLYTSSASNRYEYRIPYSGTGTTATSSLTGMFNGTCGGSGFTASLNTTYYANYLPDKQLVVPVYQGSGYSHYLKNNNPVTVRFVGQYTWQTSTDDGYGTIDNSCSANSTVLIPGPSMSGEDFFYVDVYAVDNSGTYRDSDKIDFDIYG